MSKLNVLALSWDIATQPKLYQTLAPNPYSHSAQQIILSKFPEAKTSDIIKAIILAEPEGKYDRNFRKLDAVQKARVLAKQQIISETINKRLTEYCRENKKRLRQLPKELIYDNLSILVFESPDLKKIEQKYAQNQRRDFRLLIIDFIENIRSAEEKSVSGKKLLRVTSLVISLILFFYLAAGFAQKLTRITTKQPPVNTQVLGIASQKTNSGLPTHLKIPRISVDAAIQYIGMTPDGAMDVPDNTVDVGWYKLGSRPGEMGSAVISGHFDGRFGESGVFNNLDKLKPGDKIYVIDNLGTPTTFVVRESRTFSPGYADEVFYPNDNGTHLNLITCDGVWDGAKKSYSKRLVVFADISNQL